MKPEVIRETVMRFAADEWRATNHAMCKPWQNAAGVAMPPAGMRELANRLAALFKKEHDANLKAKRFAALERRSA